MSTQSNPLMGKLSTEFKTVEAMVEIYCQHHHKEALVKPNKICDDCQQLLDYAQVRLDRCPYGENKPTCNKCPIHCYKPEPKLQMQTIMRFAGPRMLLKHPILAIRHLIYERKAVPAKPLPNQSNRHQRLKKK